MNRNSDYNVTDLMTGDLVSVMPDSRCGAALDILDETGLHALPAIDSRGVAVGLVTLADLIGANRDHSVSSCFSGPPITVAVSTTIPDAARLMRQEYVHHLIVTDGPVAIGMLTQLRPAEAARVRRLINARVAAMRAQARSSSPAPTR